MENLFLVFYWFRTSFLLSTFVVVVVGLRPFPSLILLFGPCDLKVNAFQFQDGEFNTWLLLILWVRRILIGDSKVFLTSFLEVVLIEGQVFFKGLLPIVPWAVALMSKDGEHI